MYLYTVLISMLLINAPAIARRRQLHNSDRDTLLRCCDVAPVPDYHCVRFDATASIRVACVDATFSRGANVR